MRPSSFRLKAWSVSDRRQIQRVSDGSLTQAVLAPALTTSPERAEDTRPSQLCGLSGYGSAKSDNVPTLEPCGQGLSPRNDPFTPAAILAPAEQGEARLRVRVWALEAAS
jgi:hypothetical protein